MKHKYLVAYDCETTGLDKVHDAIIQLSAVRLNRETLEEIDTFNSYVIPSTPWHISAAASEVNGMTDEDIKAKGRPAKEVFTEFLKYIEDCDYLTFNGNSFDVEFLYRDMSANGLELPIADRTFFDSKFMETKINSNRLIACYERYMGKTMEEDGLNAHDSLSDTKATVAVFKAQLAKLNMSADEVAEWSENQMFSPEGSIKNAAHTGQDELLVFKNGKYKDQDMFSVMQTDPGYLRWWSEKVATSYSRDKARKYLLNRKKQEGC